MQLGETSQSPAAGTEQQVATNAFASAEQPTAPQPPFASPEQESTTASSTYQQCDECGAPVDEVQRYCVACGAHRRHVKDPAARYLSQATARARVSKGAATRKARRAGGSSRGLIVALAIAIVPVTAAIGVEVGRSSNNDDSKLIQALEHHQAAAASTTTVPAATTANVAAATKTSAHSKAKHHAAKAASKAATLSPKNAGKVITKTQYGSAQQITGFKPNKAQEQQGAQATQKVQKSTGKTYVNGQSSLPSQVVVP